MKTCIVVSGGDAPGINAAIDSYARLAHDHGASVVGVHGGFAGLLSGDISPLDPTLLALLSGRGGSILRSSREPALAAADARDSLQSVMTSHAIDNILLFGGDGSIRFILPLLRAWDIPCIALPTTIDNDVPGAAYTLGHDSACNYARQSIAGIRSTASALPGRIFLVVTLGGFCGRLALEIAYASKADAVLLPEYDFQMRWLAERCQSAVKQRGFALVVAAEGAPNIESLPGKLADLSGIRVRETVLGHAQRGGDISHRDLVVARDMSRIAWQAFKAGARHGLVVCRDGVFALRDALATDETLPAPDYAKYAFINGL